jgi:hypothetical protein
MGVLTAVFFSALKQVDLLNTELQIYGLVPVIVHTCSNHGTAILHIAFGKSVALFFPGPCVHLYPPVKEERTWKAEHDRFYHPDRKALFGVFKKKTNKQMGELAVWLKR